MIHKEIERMLKDVNDTIFMIENHGERHDDALVLSSCLTQKKVLQHLQSFPIGEFSEEDVVEMCDDLDFRAMSKTEIRERIDRYRKQKEGGR